MLPDFTTIASAGDTVPAAETLGHSREGRPVRGYRLGRGSAKVSLLAGCHADEPVGPRLLERVVCFLASLGPSHDTVSRFQWWVVPHLNPDGAARNADWSDGVDDAFDIADYLANVVREGPGDDVEFGFPRDPGDDGARPENRAVYHWWRRHPAPFALHASLHGMAVAAGPWFLIDAAWAERCEPFQQRCRDETSRLGYVLHDVERRGEKGFRRLERGFCTRPDSGSMTRYFLERGDDDTAALFRPSSMETIRDFGGDALTLVSEIPLFITPGAGETIAPIDGASEAWRARLEGWKSRLESGGDPAAVRAQAEASGLYAVPIAHQMQLQWEMIRAGLALVAR